MINKLWFNLGLYHVYRSATIRIIISNHRNYDVTVTNQLVQGTERALRNRAWYISYLNNHLWILKLLLKLLIFYLWRHITIYGSRLNMGYNIHAYLMPILCITCRLAHRLYIVRFTLNSLYGLITKVNEFRGLRSKLWTNFHDILNTLLSSHAATTLKF